MVHAQSKLPVPDYQMTSTEVFKLAGKQFKAQAPRQACGAYGAGRLETVTTVPHEDLILCEAVIVFEAYAPPARTSPNLGLLACRQAQECARDRAQLAHRAHQAPRARRRVLGCRYGPRQRVAPVCSERRLARAVRCDLAMWQRGNGHVRCVLRGKCW
jgi:hypothetical protein